MGKSMSRNFLANFRNRITLKDIHDILQEDQDLLNDLVEQYGIH